MPKVPYTKPALTYQQQLDQLKDRGLKIDNEAKALHLLENISYYRLSGYWYPLLADKVHHAFKPEATFDSAFKLYCFDRELRRMVLAEIEKIEIAVRAKMIYIMSHKHGPFWFSDASLFRDQNGHADTIAKITMEYDRSDEEFIKAFKDKYSDPLPPSWITTEVTSFGTLSILYSNLLPGRDKRDIANYFGLSDTVFSSWLHSIVYLRNVCAHHTRLWNRGMSIRPRRPEAARKQWLVDEPALNNRTYFILSMIAYLLQTVNPGNSFSARFKSLLGQYPNVDVRALGFTVDWESEQLWK